MEYDKEEAARWARRNKVINQEAVQIKFGMTYTQACKVIDDLRHAGVISKDYDTTINGYRVVQVKPR